jgi:hypothetical protein
MIAGVNVGMPSPPLDPDPLPPPQPPGRVIETGGHNPLRNFVDDPPAPTLRPGDRHAQHPVRIYNPYAERIHEG